MQTGFGTSTRIHFTGRRVCAALVLVLGLFLSSAPSFALPPSMSAPSADYDGTFVVSWSINAPSGQGYSNLNQRINGGSWAVVSSQGVSSYTYTVNASTSATYDFYVSYGYLPQPCGQGCGLITGSTSTQTTVVTINTAPTISNIGNQTINEDGNTGSLGFTIGDAETAAGSLTVTASSSNTALVPNNGANLTLGGSGASRNITVTPAANQNGSATITVSVSDGMQTTSDTFTLTVNAVNDAPTISNISNQTINEDANTGSLGFTIGDDQTAVGSLTVTASSSNTTLVPNSGANLTLGGSGASRTLTVTPVANQTGTSTITVTVSDGTLSASDTFTLTVNAVNDAPTISSIGNVSINEGASTGAIAFTVGDLETAAGSLTVSASSSNTAVIPGVALGGSGASRTVSVTAKNDNGVGSSTITVTVSDGSLSANETFTVTVNDIPATFTMTTSTDSDGDGAYTLSWIAGDDNVRVSENSVVIIEQISPSVSGYPRTQTQNGTYNYTLEDCHYEGPTRVCDPSDTATMVVSGITHPPTISNVANQTINEDGSTGSIGFTVGDGNIETSPGSLTVTASSSNTTLIPNGNLVLGGTGANRTITVTPAANLSGSATITVTVSDGSLTANDTFLVTVNSVNDTPTISNILNQTINEDASTGALGFSVGDVETAAGSLTVTASSSNTALVPNNSANLTLGGSGASRTLTVTPAANQNGTATITVTVSDGVNSANDTFTLTVNAVNDAPTISNISNQTINEDGTTGSIPFTVGDLETAAGSLTVTASSSNTTLVPNNSANLLLGGSGSGRTVTVTPAAIQTGTTTITVTVSDGTLSTSDTFVVTVNVVNDVPTISNIADQTINEDANTGGLGFTVGDEETAAGSLTVTASSSNTTLVPNNSANLSLGGSGAGRTLTVTPAANQSGFATITVTVSDGVNSAQDTFVLTVMAVNDVPTITDINHQTIGEDANTGSLGFTVGDVETAAGSLTVTASSSNTTLVPDNSANLSLGGSGASRMLTVTPAANQNGSATITVTVSDGTASSSDTFTLTVSAVNDVPTVSDIGNQTINEDGTTGSLGFTIGDAETAAGSLTVTASSSNTTLVPNSSANLALGGSGASRTLNIMPVAGKSGTATITVTVSDGDLSASDTFTLTVNAVNDVPTISNILNQTINQDGTTGSLGFTVSDQETATSSLTVTATSSNTVLVPSGNLSLVGTGGSRSITVTPAPSQSGTVTITVNVSDGSLSASDTFDVAVNMVPQSPSDSDGDGNFTVSWNVDPGPNQGGYADLKQRFNGGGWTFVTQKPLGSQSHPISVSASGIYEYKVDYAYMPQDPGCGPGCNPQLIPGTMTLPTVVVLITPGSPSIGSTTGDGCAGSLSVNWLGGTGYPTGATIYYDLQESVNGGAWTPRLFDTTFNSWSGNAAAADSYQYRLRSRYTLSGYYSNYTGWVSNSAFVMPGCTGGGGGGETIPQPPEPPSDPIGSVEGTFNVAPSGAASYSVPLEVPPGIGGMAPKLSLDYNSQGGTGFVGTGWSLGGLSTITRCAATQEPDGIVDGVDFDANDRFCLDGKKLILVPNTGAYGAPGSEYRTEIDSFSKIVAVGTAGIGPASFTVYARTGEEMLYGARVSGDSRIEAQGRSEVMTWALDTITDSTGNKMEFYYTEITANTEYVPLRVEYAFTGGVSGARVEFDYSVQGSPTMYVAGSTSRNTRLLQTVTTYVDTSQAVKRYELDYDVAPATKRPRLTSLTECSLVSGAVCLEPTVFSWYGGQTPLGVTNLGNILSDHTIGWNGAGQWAIDVDGDGIQELVYNRHGHPEYYYVKKTGSTWSTQLWVTFQQSVAAAHHYWPMDVNGDGLTDLVYMSGSDFYVVVNHGDGTTSHQHWGSRLQPMAYDKAFPLDVNNDGRMDLVYAKGEITSRSYYALIAGDNFNALEDYLGERGNHWVGLDGLHWAADINSDGRSDLVYVEAGTKNYWALVNNGAGTWIPEFLVTRTFDADYAYVNWPMDVNVDGLLDFVYVKTGISGEYRVLINKGDGSMADEYFSTRQETPGWDGAHWVIDVNADGVSDLVYTNGNYDYYAMVSQPDGTRQHELWGSNIFIIGGDGRHLEMDANGDGFVDLLVNVQNTKQYSAIGMQSSFDLLKTVTDGYGNVTSIQYKQLTNSTVYDRVENPAFNYPTAAATVPMRVVSKVTAPDGVGDTRDTEYFYKKLKVNRTGRGSLGFAEVISIDTKANIRVETKHKQAFPFTGLVSESTRCLDTGGVCQPNKILQKTANTYEYCGDDEQEDDCPEPASARFLYPSQTVETVYGLNNMTDTTTAMAVITTKNENPDDYGNIQLITVETDSQINSDFYKTTTANVYANDTANWHLGLLTSTTVTKYLNGGTATDANSVRKTAFEYFPITNLLQKETVEPDPEKIQFRLVTAYERDGYGNITKATACAADFGNCGESGQTGPGSLPFRTVETVYDTFGQFPQSVTNAEDESENYVYDRKFGNKLSLTGPNGLTTSWTYDGFGKLLKETRADGSRTVTTYKWCDGDCPPHGRYYVVTQSTGSAPVTEYFDAQNRKLRTRSVGFNGRNIHVDTVYNSLGQPAQVSEPYFQDDPAYWTQSEYDAIGRVVTMTPPLSPAVRTEYDLLTVTMSRIANGEFRTESETRNSIGQTVSVTNPAGTTLLYTYDSQGNLKTTQTQGYANTLITVTYDLHGRKTQMIDPDMGTWNYQYNGYGDLISQTNAMGNTVTMTYDKLGRLTGRDEPEGVTTWVYGTSATAHNVGKLVSVSAPGGQGSKNYTYDSLGRLIETTTQINIAPYPTNPSYAVGQTYDAAGRVSTVLYPEVETGPGVMSRFEVKNHYSPLGYLSKVTSPDGSLVYWEAQEMNARGQLEIAQLGNGAGVVNTYMPETGWLDGIMVDANDLIYQMSYNIDEAGNIESRTDMRQNLTEAFQYDILDQLTNSSITGGAGSYTPKSYAYDALGNITSKTGVGSYTYGTCGAGPHAVCQAGGSTYAYNANGSMVNKNGGTDEIQYTSFNMPYQFDGLGSHSVTFHYGPDRTRIFKSGANGTTAYIGMTDTGNALYEHEVQGTTEKHLHFIYAGGQALAVHTIQTGSGSQTKTEYLHRDHLGSVEAVSNSAGVAVAYFSHDPWGKPRNADWTDATGTPSGAPGNLGFTGHEMIPEVGLVHMNGRVYDPLLGKFLSADPNVQFAKDVRSYNRYSYVSNNPLRYTDPTGYFLNRLSKWISKHFITILNVVSWFYPPVGYFVMALNIMTVAHAASSPGQAIAGILIPMVGGGIGQSLAKGVASKFLQAVVLTASGGFTGGISAMLTGGNLRRGIQEGMRGAAINAALRWGLMGSPVEEVSGNKNSNTPAPPPPEVIDGGGKVSALEAELAKLPEAVLTKLKEGGVKFVAVKDSIVEHLTHLAGVTPRGHPPGTTWDTVPAVYDPNSNTVVVATSGKYGHGSYNLALHEIGHAYDHVTGMLSNSNAFKSAYRRDYTTLGPYYQQPGAAGRSEAFAESFANYYGGNSSYSAAHPNLGAYWSNQGQ